MLKHIVSLILLCTSLVLHGQSVSPVIEKGVMDLRSSDQVNNQIIHLKGDWNLVLGQFLFNDDLKNVDYSIFQPSPGEWNGALWNNQKFSGRGHGTYYIKVLVDKEVKDLAIKIFDVGLSYRVYVNDTFLGQGGVPGTGINDEQPKFKPFIYAIPDEAYSSELNVIVQVSNYHHQSGGMWRAPVIGNETILRAYYTKRMSFELLILGSILIIGIYHLILYLIRQKEKFSLYLFLICISLFSNYMSINEMYILNLYPHLDWLVIRKIGYITLFMVAPLNILFINRIFPNEGIRVLNRIFAYPTMAIMVITIFLPNPYANFFVVPYQYITLLTGLILFYILVKATRNKRRSAWFFMIGIMLAYITVVNDILLALYIIDSERMVHFGVLIYIITLSYVVARKYAIALSSVESLGEELKEINANLEEKVKIRTQDLESQKEIIEKKNQEISIKNDELIHVNEEQKNLLAMVAHDLRSPLNKILGLANIMGHSLHKEENTEINRTILNIAEEGRKFITDITRLSSYERDDYHPNLEPHDISVILKQKVKEFELIAKEKSISIESGIQSDVIADTDDELIGRIVDNLITNAIKFSTFDKKIWVTLSSNETNYTLKVKDQGPGFTDSDKSKLYRKFQKLSARPTKGESSSGLGLSIVKTLIEKVNGSIELESEQGKGSEFIVTLPLIIK